MLQSYTAETTAASFPRPSRVVVRMFSLGLAASLAWSGNAMAQSGSRPMPQQSFQQIPQQSFQQIPQQSFQSMPMQTGPVQGSQTQQMMVPQGSQTHQQMAPAMATQGSQSHQMAPAGSGTQPMATQGSGTQPMASQGSGMHSAASAGSQSHAMDSSVALSGYCPICVTDMKKWVKGSPEHQVAYDGKTYLFPDEKLKAQFAADPGKYVPAMGGDCTVCAVDSGQKVPGSVQFSSLYKNRLYLFPGQMQKEAFGKNPAKYANADVAMDGKCTVCRVDMNKDVEGKPEFTSFYGGKRYMFPGKEQQETFMANPAKYVQ